MTNPRRQFLRSLGAGALALGVHAGLGLGTASVYAGPPAETGPEAPSIPAGAPTPEDPQFAAWMMDHIDDLYRGASSHGLMEMHVKTKHWTRQIAMESWSLGEDYSLVRIVAPKKERGTATLKANDDLFTYLSKTGRTIKITGGMMGSSWMGSHFTNDDLVRDNRLIDSFEVRRATTRETAETYVFELMAKPDAPVVWGKVEIVVRRADLLPVEQTFYDEDLEAARRLTFSAYQEMAGRTLPTVMRMEPLDGSGEFTEVRQRRLELDIALEPTFFSLQKLRTL